MEAQLSLGPPPAMSILAVVPAVADPTEPGRIRLHHASQRRDARRQAEALEARSDLLPSLFNDCRRDNPRRCYRLTHGVALLRGLSTPSLLAQGGQRLPHIFNIGRDISRSISAHISIAVASLTRESTLSKEAFFIPRRKPRHFGIERRGLSTAVRSDRGLSESCSPRRSNAGMKASSTVPFGIYLYLPRCILGVLRQNRQFRGCRR